MVFEHPVWLLLAIPLAVMMRVWRLPSRLLQVLRAVALALILLAMAAPTLKLPSRAGTVVVVADRSHSMPHGGDTTMKETITLLRGGMVSNDSLAVVSFGETAVIERPPQRGAFGGFVTEVGRDGSSLADAIDLALAMIPPKHPGRVLVLSDGRWTGRDPAGPASRAASRGIAVDYRLLQRPVANDVAILRLDAPGTVTPGESYTMTAWVYSPVPQDVAYKLMRGDVEIAGGAKAVPSGTSRLVFRDKAAEPGTFQYLLRITAGENDPVPENNLARLLVGIQGPRPILCLPSTPDSALPGLLRAGGLDVKTARANAMRWSLEELSGYSSLLVENVPANDIGERGMATLAKWVEGSGAGIMLTGGRDAYGPGGYYKSPLEPVMPVSMELRKEHRKLALAIVVALDRSGSMMAPASGGKTKMDLANLASAEVLNLLTAMDEFGVIAVDSTAHTIVKLGPVTNKGSTRRDILRIQSMGGGIFIYEALAASAKMLNRAHVGTRHIILFADAADSEEPGNYKALLEKAKKAGMTCSVIGLGSPSDCDADLLRDVAKRGNGRCYFTNKANELPRLFAQDTFVVARSAFLDELTAIRATGGMVALTGKQFEPPKIGGYNLCYLRPGAMLGMVSVDEYKAPVVAAWQVGIGRALCYTGEADGEFTGPIARWPGVGDFLTSMARWTAGGTGELPGNMLLTQEIEHGVCTVQLHLDPERETDTITELPRVSVLRGTPGETPRADERAAMQWTLADTLAVQIPISGGETALSTVEVPGIGPVTLAPVCLPYSPEYVPQEGDTGRRTMEHIARATGGIERVNLPALWDDLPKAPRYIGIAHWLLFLGLIVFLLEVLERRTGVVSMLRLRRRRAAEAEAAPPRATRVRARRLRRIRLKRFKRRRTAEPEGPEPEATEPAEPVEKPPPAPPPTEEEHPTVVDAFRKARDRAKHRTRR